MYLFCIISRFPCAMPHASRPDLPRPCKAASVSAPSAPRAQEGGNAPKAAKSPSLPHGSEGLFEGGVGTAAGGGGSCGYSHSIVPGGFVVMSYTTRFTPGTSLMIRFEIVPSTSCGMSEKSTVMASAEDTARTAITLS